MYRRKVKVVFLGDSGVGKTSIILCHDGRTLNPEYTATLGANFVVSSIKVGSDLVEMQIWDTAGQERFRSMVPMYLRNSKAAVVVFDITNRASFESLKSWVDEVFRCCSENVIFVILGNKKDLEKHRVVSAEEAQEFARGMKAAYFETSALQNVGIVSAMSRLAEDLLLSQIRSSQDALNLPTQQELQPEKKKKGCCRSS